LKFYDSLREIRFSCTVATMTGDNYIVKVLKVVDIQAVYAIDSYQLPPHMKCSLERLWINPEAN